VLVLAAAVLGVWQLVEGPEPRIEIAMPAQP
jgi:hypothetical protein